MNDITIIGTGSMARSIAVRALAGGRSVQLLAHDDKGKADKLAAELSGADKTSTGRISTGIVGDGITGAIVIGAVPFDAAKMLVTEHRGALGGKVYVDITNPVDASTFEGLAVPHDTSAAEELQKTTDARVVKAFNTTFAGPLVQGEVAGQPLDVLIAGDDDEAVRAVADLVRAGGLTPIVVGPLRRARQLEQAGFLHMLLQANEGLPEFQWDTALRIVRAE
ncbi:NAD(P)-binding domain-containing protein [Sinomonas sp. JGH33]|uniref:NAD(P)-binding domain-containing protein n=1 Tax=Sinomonas terricola TaxID=3110330 RepID=A0ABU5T7K0_9MICC|nr:NAD(P)-binding domain-containing protein [Sinomonas sp. JGH33]MEA5455657.1 NAD(P)-binding domain-containing protein [Sinomonas sp. JGH33]